MKRQEWQRLKKVLEAEKDNLDTDSKKVIEDILKSNEPNKKLLEKVVKLIVRYLFFEEFIDTN